MTTQGKIAAILNPGRMLADGIPLDYLVPGIDNVSPEILVEHMEIPTPLNPDGIKGGGEGGAVGAPAAIANAVANAISPARITATPLFPARVHQAIVDAGLARMVAQEVT